MRFVSSIETTPCPDAVNVPLLLLYVRLIFSVVATRHASLMLSPDANPSTYALVAES